MPAAPATIQADQADQVNSARMFKCARCQAQVLVCKACDRGQRYCGQRCREQARRESGRAAGQRYQSSRAGRFAHARRAGVYRQRQRQKIVTHQGCPVATADAVLEADLTDLTVKQDDAACKPLLPWRCHWCARVCRRVDAADVLPHLAHRGGISLWDGTATQPPPRSST